MSSTLPAAPLLRVLHVDDDPFELDRVRKALETYAIDCRFAVESLASAAACEARLVALPTPDIVVLDIHLGDGVPGGIELAAKTRRLAPQAVIIMCSSADDVSSIAEGLGAGADDFLSKKSDRAELALRIYNSYRLSKLKQGGTTADGPSRAAATSKMDLVGATMERVARRMPLIINSAITAVFIGGESGTGKEVVASICAHALKAGTPFVAVNCGAIAPTLLESELFGHVKGAFTGAATDKRGLFEAASGGWIFLDEVATLSPAAQVALLRVLENKELLRVGSTKPITIDVRVLCATNENMDQLVKDGKFRRDLWQRLREAEVLLPPLRERPDEIRPLIAHFCKTMAGGPYQASGPVMEVLVNVSWREGNVRELRNCLRAMTEMHVNKLLTPLAIPKRIWEEFGDKPKDDQAIVTAGAPEAPASGGNISLPWRQNYDDMADLLLIEMTRCLAKGRAKQIPLRELSELTGLARSTLSGRFQTIRHKNLVDWSELAKIVSVGEKGGEKKA